MTQQPRPDAPDGPDDQDPRVVIIGPNGMAVSGGAPDPAEGEAGDIQWNFEKFLVSADGRVLNRFRPQTTPDDPAVIDAIEAAL